MYTFLDGFFWNKADQSVWFTFLQHIFQHFVYRKLLYVVLITKHYTSLTPVFCIIYFSDLVSNFLIFIVYVYDISHNYPCRIKTQSPVVHLRYISSKKTTLKDRQQCRWTSIISLTISLTTNVQYSVAKRLTVITVDLLCVCCLLLGIVSRKQWPCSRLLFRLL